MKWKDIGRVSVGIYSGSWKEQMGIGVNIELGTPAIDIFIGWYMITITNRLHRQWIEEQIADQNEIGKEGKK